MNLNVYWMINLTRTRILNEERNKMMSNLNNFVQQFFNWVMETTLVCSVLVVLILFIKLILRNKLPPRWHYIIWISLLFRLMLPPIPEGYNKFLNILPEIKQTSSISLKIAATEEPTYYLNPVKSNFQDYSIQKLESKHRSFSLIKIASYVWFIGVICIGILTLALNVRMLLYIKRQPLITDLKVSNIFQYCKDKMSLKSTIPLVSSGKLPSPTVLGFIQPKILISQTHLEMLTEQQIKFIFFHELAHIKLKDIVINCLANSLLILHWFNPILWYAYYRMRQDQEIGCDAVALHYIGERQKVEYGHTIIRLLDPFARRYPISSAANMAGGNNNIKRRILMIKKFQKKSNQWTILGIAILVSLLAFFFVRADIVGLNNQNLEVKAATNEGLVIDNQKLDNNKQESVPMSNDIPKPMVKKENSEVVAVHSSLETSREGLKIIQQNAPFKVLVPGTNKLSEQYLIHASMNKVRENTNERNVDISYLTPGGEVHIWESNLNVKNAEKNPIQAPGYNYEIIKIGTQDWYFTPHLDDKDLLIFQTVIDGTVVSVDGKLPYNEMAEIISSLK
jgi:bla regulator protein blaR1